MYFGARAGTTAHILSSLSEEEVLSVNLVHSIYWVCADTFTHNLSLLPEAEVISDALRQYFGAHAHTNTHILSTTPEAEILSETLEQGTFGSVLFSSEDLSETLTQYT